MDRRGWGGGQHVAGLALVQPIAGTVEPAFQLCHLSYQTLLVAEHLATLPDSGLHALLPPLQAL